jgi:UV DNA damage repair endonuclease
MIVAEPPKIGYIGLPKRIKGDSKLSIDSPADFLRILNESISYNSGLGVNFMCLDLTEFVNLDFLKNFDFDEEDPKISKSLGQIHENLNLRKVRISVLVSKEYFLGSQLDGVPEETSIILEGLSKLMDLIGQRGRSIIVRIGSAYGNRKNTMSSFVDRYNQLSESCRKKICLVNDEKPSLFSVTDLLSGCYYKSSIPICFRFLNHLFNDGGLTVREALFLSCSTWRVGSNPILIHAQSAEEDESGFPTSTQTAGKITKRIPTFGLSLDILIDSPEKEYCCVNYIKDAKALPPIVFNKKTK